MLRLLEAFTHYSGYDNPQLLHDGDIDGLPGFVTREQDGTLQTMAFDLEEGRISTIYVVRNPDKLRHLQN